MAAVLGSLGFLLFSVTPDVFRGSPRRKGTMSDRAFLLAAEWTPDQVRGDGMGLEDGGLTRTVMRDTPPGGGGTGLNVDPL